MNRLIALAILWTAGAVFSAAKYPFPLNINYPNGIRPTLGGLNNWTNSDLQSDFEYWKSNFYSECSDGQRARVKWTDPAATAQGCNAEGGCTVSEGIGYGMLILVYMDNPTNNTQAQFDKLWKYYNSYLDSKGLMKWIVNGCDGAKADGAATDAEMDVALALAMAYQQWGKESYKTDLIALLKKIWDSEVDQGNKVLKPGSLWGDPYNPSYFATGALRVFAQVDTDKSHDWKSIADGCLALIKKNQHPTTGLVSDWCSAGGGSVDKNGSGTNKFGYDAVRTPWRVTLDYLWHGTPAAKEQMQKIVTWLKTSTGESVLKVKANYNTDGTYTGNYTNAVYWGAFTTPVMVDASSSAWLQQMSKRMNQNPDNYYQVSWQILYRLTLSGNFQNFWGPMSSGIRGGNRSIPMDWEVVSRNGRIVAMTPGVTSHVEIIDAKGAVYVRSQGKDKVELESPKERGVYFAVVRAEGKEAIWPVIGN